MIVKMVEHYGALAMVAAASCQSGHFFFQLLNQALAVRGDDVHAATASGASVEKRLRRSSETVAILLVAGEAKGRRATLGGNCQHPVDPLVAGSGIGPEMDLGRLVGIGNGSQQPCQLPIIDG